MRRLWCWAGAASVCIHVLGCGPSADVALGRTGLALQPIYNGTRLPQNVPLSDAETNAVVYIAEGDEPTQVYCTGTLIMPRVVLTARHCISDRAAWQVLIGVGLDPAEPEAIIPVAELSSHATQDVGLVLLGWDATTVGATVSPLGLNIVAPDGSWVGKSLDGAGYGQTNDGTDGRYFAELEVASFSGLEIVVNGNGLQGMCAGDSGGPLLRLSSGGQPLVVATERAGDVSCVGLDNFVRTDVIAGWIDTVLGQGLPSALQPCGMDTSAACSAEGNYTWCDGTALRERACADGCGYLGPTLGMGCLPSNCGDLDFYGQCDGDLLQWCSASGPDERQCADGCEWLSDDLGYGCCDESCSSEKPPRSKSKGCTSGLGTLWTALLVVGVGLRLAERQRKKPSK